MDNGGDNVLQLTSSGNNFDGAALTLATAIDLSDDANNTITLVIDPQDALGVSEVRTHLLKFEGGSGGLYFDTVGPDEQTININFGSMLGSFSVIVLFMDAGVGNVATGTYFIDDISGGTNAGPTCSDGIKNQDEVGIDCGGICGQVCPPASPNPSTPDGEVLSIFSDNPDYTNDYVAEGDFGIRSVESFGSPSDQVIRMDFSNAGWGQFNNTTVDLAAAGYQFINFSYYAPNISAGVNGHHVQFILSSGSEISYDLKTDGSGDAMLMFDSWQTLSIPLTSFPGFNPNNFLLYKLGSPSDLNTTIVYFDNIYFSQNAGTLSSNSFELESLNVYPNPTKNSWTIQGANTTINTIEVFDILGKRVQTLSPNNSEATIDAKDLKTGIYLAKLYSDNGTKTIKLVKE